jgi:predicted nucleotidyltransferase
MNQKEDTGSQLRRALERWAATKPTIKALYIFGSYARSEAR